MKANAVNAGTVQEMMKEARCMRDLRHENLVCFLGVVATKGPIIIVMELIRGGSLDVYLKDVKASEGEGRGQVVASEKVRMIQDVAAGLCYMHANETMHRCGSGG